MHHRECPLDFPAAPEPGRHAEIPCALRITGIGHQAVGISRHGLPVMDAARAPQGAQPGVGSGEIERQARIARLQGETGLRAEPDEIFMDAIPPGSPRLT